jgi:aromatic ring-opening dioxygenase LigB subunit
VSGVVYAAIAPHGTLAVPEASAAQLCGAERTQAAMEELGRRFQQAGPDATIVLTPHNVHIEGHFAILLAGKLAGTLAEWDAPEIELGCPVDLELAAAAVVAVHDGGLPVVGASFGANNPAAATAPMDWGTLIPLWFMGGRSEPQVPAVVVSPARDRPLDEHVRAGAALARAAAASGKRVALVASADHGHAHDPDGPYGFDPAAAEFDARVVELVRENRLAELPEIDLDLVERAKADSFWQLLMLHGALGDGGWRGELLSYEAPTYFGMLCASYTPI